MAAGSRDQAFPLSGGAAPPPFVSVIIPVYNDGNRLVACLEALEAQDFPADRYEVVVVDNASTESIEPLVRQFAHAVYGYEAKPGSYAARNKGMALARGSVFAFTDSDCIPRPDWIRSGIEALQRSECELAGGKVEIVFEDSGRPTVVELYEKVLAFPQSTYVERYAFSVTANLFALRTVAEAIGPFNDAIKSGGDREWGNRAVAQGNRIVYAENAVVAHPARRTLDEVARKAIRTSGGMFELSKQTARGHLRRQASDIGMALRPPVRAARRLWSDQRVPGLPLKLRVLGVLLFVRYVSAWERVRRLTGLRRAEGRT